MIGAAKRRIKKQYVPHDYQKQAMKFQIGNSAAALFLDPG